MSTAGILTFPIRLLIVALWFITIFPLCSALSGETENDALDFLFLCGRFHKNHPDEGY